MNSERQGTPPRVLVITTDASGIGGVPRVTRTLLRALTDLYGPEAIGLMSVWRASTGLPCRTVYSSRRAAGGRVGLVQRIAFVWHLVRSTWRWRGNVVTVACHPHLGAPAWLARAISGAPYAVWCHGEEVWGELRPSVKQSLLRADLVFAPSHFTARRVEVTASLPLDSVLVLPHCLPPEFLEPTRENGARASKQVLTVARLVHEHAYKGVDVLIGAWPRVIGAVPDAELVVVGDGADRPRLERLSHEYGVAGSTHFVGAAGDEDLRHWYSNSAVFALPSRTRIEPRPEGEGFGLVYIEAAAAGLPVVGTRGGAIDEVVVDGETGLLVDPDDDIALADALIRLLEDKGLAETLGEAGKRRARTEFGYELFRERVAGIVFRVSAKGKA